jgi:Sensors of blue-light using FAD
MALHELIYVSLAESEMSTAELSALLEKAREKNTRLGITGLLVYRRREFTQILEGDKADIFALYSKICSDNRNRGHYLMWDGPIQQRSFSDWSMAFLTPSDASLEGKPAYSGNLKIGPSQRVQSLPKTMGIRMFLLSLRDDFLR